MCGYWNSLTSGYPSGPVKITKTILESVAAWCYLRGNQALLCFMNVSELIPMSWGKKPVLHSAFRKVLHLQMKVACLPYSCLLNLCSRELVWDIILYLVIWKTNKPKKNPSFLPGNPLCAIKLNSSFHFNFNCKLISVWKMYICKRPHSFLAFLELNLCSSELAI